MKWGPLPKCGRQKSISQTDAVDKTNNSDVMIGESFQTSVYHETSSCCHGLCGSHNAVIRVAKKRRDNGGKKVVRNGDDMKVLLTI